MSVDLNMLFKALKVAVGINFRRNNNPKYKDSRMKCKCSLVWPECLSSRQDDDRRFFAGMWGFHAALKRMWEVSRMSTRVHIGIDADRVALL